MKGFDRRTFIKTTGLLGTAVLTGLAGCTGGPGDGDSTDTQASETEASETTDTETEGGQTTETTTETQTAEDSSETTAGTGPAAEDTTAVEDTTDTSTGMTSSAADSTETATGTEASAGNATGTSGAGGSGETTHVGMVYATGGLGDGSFNDQAQQGIEQATEDFDVEYRQAEPDEVQQFSNFQEQFASSTDPDYDLVSCIGFLQADALAETAPNYTDQRFQIVDDNSVEADNVASYVFREHEGSFLVGVLAAMLTTQEFSAGAGATGADSTSVGFVGGVESDLIARFEAGFKRGVAYTDENVDVQTAYVGDFNDPTGGQTAANSMYTSGADIVYHAAGNTGTGVFQAAQEQERFAIGVDRDQSTTRPDYQDVILASMVKRVDTAVYNAVEATVNDAFEGGSATTLGLEAEGVAAVYGQQLGPEIPEEVKTAVSDAREGIIGGDIDVPTDPSNV